LGNVKPEAGPVTMPHEICRIDLDAPFLLDGSPCDPVEHAS
jgi:hypothetical protein